MVLCLRLCITFAGRLTGKGLDVDDAGPRLHLAGEQREVLAQWKAFELTGQIEMSQAGVTGEVKPVHLPRLPLVPVGTGEDVGDRVDLRMDVVEVGLERQPDVLGD